MLEFPADLNYTKSHMWAKTDPRKKRAMIGVTEHLTEELGEILSVDVPMVGDELDMESLCLHLHVGPVIRHLCSPLSGRVLEINREVLDSPSLLHLSPYVHWIYKMEYDEPEEIDMLMSGKQYADYLDHL